MGHILAFSCVQYSHTWGCPISKYFQMLWCLNILPFFSPFLSFSWKIASMRLLFRIDSVRSCRSYDDVFRFWLFETICKSFLSRREFLWKVCTYWCKEIVEVFCFFNWISNGIIISNYGKCITAFLFFSGRYDFTYTLSYCFGIFFILFKMMLIVSLFTLPY